MLTINIQLNHKSAIGTKAFVTKTRWFRKPITEVYVCTAANPIMGGIWANESTGEELDLSSQISRKINYAAQAAVALANVRV